MTQTPSIQEAVEAVVQTRRATRLRLIPLFADLDLADLLALGAALQSVAFPAGVDVVRQGESGDTLYLIGRGAAAVLITGAAGEQEIDRMADGDYFGEFALFSGGTRTATVRTTEPTEFYTLSHARFAALLDQKPALRAGVDAARRARWAKRLRLIPLFAGLAPTIPEALAAVLRWERRAAGEIIVRQGEPAATLYILQQGTAEGVIETRDGEQQVALLGAGDAVAALVALDGGRHPATVRAIQPVELYCLDRAAVRMLLAQAPDLRERLRAREAPPAPLAE